MMGEIRIITAEKESVPIIERIAAAAIMAVYPRYYPEEVVEFFLKLHQGTNIEKDVLEKKTCIAYCGDTVAGIYVISDSGAGDGWNLGWGEEKLERSKQRLIDAIIGFR